MDAASRKKDVEVTSSSARDVFAALRSALSTQNTASVADISRRLKISNNKAYRAVTTLERFEYLKRNVQTGGFTIGSAAEKLVQQAFKRLAVRTFMLPYLRQIATSAEETVGLVIRVGWYGVRVANIESAKNVVARGNRLGAATVLGGEAGGLAILSTLPPGDIKRFAAFVKSREAQVEVASSERALNRLLQTSRAQGFAALASDQVDSIAIPLRPEAQAPSFAAVTIEGPASRAVPLDRDPRLQNWIAIVAEAEATLRVAPQKLSDPFAHLDPDSVRF
jgi:DNA-binding IclR family transcriptional regulator